MKLTAQPLSHLDVLSRTVHNLFLQILLRKQFQETNSFSIFNFQILSPYLYGLLNSFSDFIPRPRWLWLVILVETISKPYFFLRLLCLSKFFLHLSMSRTPYLGPIITWSFRFISLPFVETKHQYECISDFSCTHPQICATRRKANPRPSFAEPSELFMFFPVILQENRISVELVWVLPWNGDMCGQGLKIIAAIV